MLSFSQKKSQQLNEALEKIAADCFCVIMDKDGKRMFNIKLGINDNMPFEQRYDRYVGLIGQIQDIKEQLKMLWDQYCFQLSKNQNSSNQEQNNE